MIKTTPSVFGRLVTAMVTPFDDEMRLDLKATATLVEHLLLNGTESIVVSGTTGESPTLEDSEKELLLKTVVQHSAGKAKIIMGTGSNDTAKSAKASKLAEAAGADGVLVVAPYYNKPSQEGLAAHFETVAKATALPVVMYNIPGRTGINITADSTIEMSQRIPNLHALKDSTGNTDQAAEIAGKARPDFLIYSGDDNMTLPFLSVGACGVISVASHVAGPAIAQMMKAFFDGNLDKARGLHYEYLPLFKGLFVAPNPTCVKYALSTMGICKANLRLPLTPLPAAQRQLIDRLLRDLKGTAIA